MRHQGKEHKDFQGFHSISIAELDGLMQSVYDIYDDPMEYPVPAFFISGDRDYICNYTLAEKYCKDITAPVKEFAAMPGCGHVPQFAEPEVFAVILRGMLDKAE